MCEILLTVSTHGQEACIIQIDSANDSTWVRINLPFYKSINLSTYSIREKKLVRYWQVLNVQSVRMRLGCTVGPNMQRRGHWQEGSNAEGFINSSTENTGKLQNIVTQTILKQGTLNTNMLKYTD